MAGDEYTPSAAGNSHNLVPGVWLNPMSVIANRVAATACLVFISLPRSVSMVIRQWSIRLEQRQIAIRPVDWCCPLSSFGQKALHLIHAPGGKTRKRKS